MSARYTDPQEALRSATIAEQVRRERTSLGLPPDASPVTCWALSICGSVVSTHRRADAAYRAAKGRPQAHVYAPENPTEARREARRNRRGVRS